jgi:hypothetical protein
VRKAREYPSELGVKVMRAVVDCGDVPSAAAKLCLSEAAVYKHLACLRRRSRVRSTIQLTAIFTRPHWLDEVADELTARAGLRK